MGFKKEHLVDLKQNFMHNPFSLILLIKCRNTRSYIKPSVPYCVTIIIDRTINYSFYCGYCQNVSDNYIVHVSLLLTL